jgi:hypothetical protein
MKPTKIILALLILFIPATLIAGGDSFDAEILNFSPKGNDEFKMTLLQYTGVYGEKDPQEPRKLIIHLRYFPRAFGKSRPSNLTRENYMHCISLLEKQLKKGGRFHFGIMAQGYKPIPGKKNEYQSNALAYLEEVTGAMVVYSFANP